MINPNVPPTEEQISEYAERLFPGNLEGQMAFTLGVWKSILDTKDSLEAKARVKTGNINEA